MAELLGITVVVSIIAVLGLYLCQSSLTFFFLVHIRAQFQSCSNVVQNITSTFLPMVIESNIDYESKKLNFRPSFDSFPDHYYLSRQYYVDNLFILFY